MPSYKTRAIILKRRNQGESDRVLTLFSHEFGKFNAIAKSARKSKSKLSGSCELFTESEFVLSSGKSFEIVTESSPIHYFQPDNADLNLVNLAHFFAEVALSVTIEKQPSEIIYQGLSEALSSLGSIDSNLIEIFFCSKILKATGSYPELATCLACNEKPKEEVLFSHTAGGIFCNECKPTAESLFYISKDVVKLWRFISETDIQNIAKINVDQQIISETAAVSRTFLCNITGKDFCTANNLRLTTDTASGII